MTIWIAMYAAVLATTTLLLGPFRAWLRERHPVRVRVSRHVYPSDQTRPRTAVTISCVNRTYFPVRITSIAVARRKTPFRRRPDALFVIPIMPRDVDSWRRASWTFVEDSAATVDLSADQPLWVVVLLDDERVCLSRRTRLRLPGDSCRPARLPVSGRASEAR